MFKYQYVKRHIKDAVECLCIGEGDARSRLAAANDVTSNLVGHHFPDELLPIWDDIQRKLTKYGPCKDSQGKIVEGSISHTLRRIKNSTASDIASRILKLHYLLEKDY
ncbi:hypothetical protein D8T63_19840 [Vibrio vulnificus]|uniref:hypothetical protein n=1 Tax=Vibrio vulnificus TaxID=672 RepID=UPI0010292DE3|nr:hypothetical protein [Vibrio vulnificus]RZR22103.1 hypothetical protein D8T63_19840 [Vibrio vulnificus]